VTAYFNTLGFTLALIEIDWQAAILAALAPEKGHNVPALCGAM
jgi:hypothetical protein